MAAVYAIENLHLPEHLMTAAVFRDMTKGTFYAGVG
jgi:hypothetical protein